MNRILWKDALAREKPLLLPVAHDALTARLIERAGFSAYQVGGFALSGSLYAVPDMEIEHYADASAAVRRIIQASPLPVLIDADDGYGDAKNVTWVIRGYEALGVSGVFIEDQKGPKRCGHMAGKEVVPRSAMIAKIKAALDDRANRDFFILARTDAIEPLGLDEAIARGKACLEAGADGVYVEGPRNEDELERIGRELGPAPLATSILERGGKTPWTDPTTMGEMGYSMILYPTTTIFALTRRTECALANLRAGKPLCKDAVTMDQFEEIMSIKQWQSIDEKFKESRAR